MSSSTQSQTVSAPAPVTVRTMRSPPSVYTTDPIDDFFGYTLSSSRTHESRHDRSISDVPPPYVEDLPPYTRKDEPETLAKYLFKFGFLFPLFWIMGAFILVSPLRAPPTSPSEAWLPEKTEAERQAIIAKMRSAELKWARRCLWALVALACLGGAIGVTVWAILKA